MRMELEGIDLRNVRMAGVRILGVLGPTVRTGGWDTIPPVIRGRRVERGPDRFTVEVVADYRHAGLDLGVTTRITGTPDGSLRMTFDASARSSFPYERIGLVLTHPIESHRGRPFVATGRDGRRAGSLPDRIAPVRIEDGHDVPLIGAFHALELALDGITARFEFDGEDFEMEDQRNWSDDSLKTFCTPLAIPTPFLAAPGQHLRQTVTLSVGGSPRPRRRLRTSVQVGEASGRAVPGVGLGASMGPLPSSGRALALLRGLAPAHLRVDLDPQEDPSWLCDLRRAADEAARIGAPLEVAASLDADASGFGGLAKSLAAIGSEHVARIIIAPRRDPAIAEGLPTPVLLRSVRSALHVAGLEVPLVAGTDGSFCEVNRGVPDPSDADGIGFPINPTVHEWGDAQVMANLATHGELIRQARELASDRPVHVGPVDLATRYGPYACGPEGADGWPPGIDVRQTALFGAAWTLGHLVRAVTGGATTVTLGPTLGWRGVITPVDPAPVLGAWRPGDPFPVYHVIADIAPLQGQSTLEVANSQPDDVATLAVESDAGRQVFVGNLLPRRRTVRISGLMGTHVWARVLSAETVKRATSQPLAFRRTVERMDPTSGALDVSLDAYATVRLDVALGR